MKSANLYKATVALRAYEAPACEIFTVGLQRVICGSETEHVGEDEGEW